MDHALIAVADRGLPGPIRSPFDTAMAGLPTLWGRLQAGTRFGEAHLRAAVAEAEIVVGWAALPDEVRAIGRVATSDEVKRFLQMLVSAWPNASQGDLAGFGLQLRSDVEQQRPSVYALQAAAKQLRRTSKFLPAIAEVLDALEAADKHITAAVTTIDRIPAALNAARVLLDQGGVA